MTDHPSTDTLDRFASGAMPSTQMSSLQAHLLECARCRAQVEERTAAWAGDTFSGEWSTPGQRATELATPALPGQDVPVGTLVGRYVVVGHLGQGAMGLVLGAYDPRLERKVAIKLLRPDVLGNAALRTRLLREARALAQLTHPNVVHVHDVDDWGDSVFLAMDFVEGTTLTRWLQSSEWTWRERVATFTMAGRGLAAAHAAGLVHRDFKPDNVLVGRDGVVRVTDFGVARRVKNPQDPDAGAHEETLSGASSLVGTPAYMSPEQFEGKPADARSDQFGFCIALYEALFRRRPFHGNTLNELRASTLAGKVEIPEDDKGVPRWLQAVVLKGLSAAPGDRFASMEALLAALDRGTQPRGIRPAVVAALGLSVLAVAALTAREVGRRNSDPCEQAPARAQRVWNAERRPRLQTALLATGVSFAADSARLVERQLDGWVKAWPQSYQQACADARSDHAITTGAALARQACLSNQLLQLTSLLDVLEGTDARTAFRAAEAIERNVTLVGCSAVTSIPSEPEDPVLRERVRAARTTLLRARALSAAGRAPENEALLPNLLVEVRALSMRAEESVVLQQQALISRSRGKVEEAQRLGEEAVRAAEIGRADDEVVLARAELARTLLDAAGDSVRGRKVFEDTRAALARAGSSPLLDERVLAIEALLLLRESRPAEAMSLFEKLIAMRVELFGAESIATGDAYLSLASCKKERRLFDEALAHITRALEIMRKVVGANHPKVAAVLNTHAAIYGAQQRNAEALPLTEQALAILLQNPGEETIDLQAATYNLGLLYSRLKRDPEALVQMRQALAIGEKAGTTQASINAAIHAGMAEVHQNLEQYPEALAAATRGLEVREKLVGPKGPLLATPLSIRGSILIELKRYDEAAADLLRALELLEQPDANPVLREVARYELARVLWHKPAERARAVKMVEDVSSYFSAKGPNFAAYVAEADAWLRTHRK